MICCWCTSSWCHSSGVLGVRLISCLSVVVALSLMAPTGAGANPSGDVDVFVGTGGQAPWRSGGTTPAAALPFGMVQLDPDTTADPAGGPSANPAGYAATDPLLRGLSPTHLSGSGCPVFGDARVLPVAGPLALHGRGPSETGSPNQRNCADPEDLRPIRVRIRAIVRIRKI